MLHRWVCRVSQKWLPFPNLSTSSCLLRAWQCQTTQRLGVSLFFGTHIDRVEAALAGQPTRSAGDQRGSAGWVDGGERGVVRQGMACGLI
jgi:hypothetical protein